MSHEDAHLAETKPTNIWPPYKQNQQYVIDNVGVIWLLVPEYDGGMATTATAAGVHSVGINTLKKERGPLRIFNLIDPCTDFSVWLLPLDEERQEVPTEFWYYHEEFKTPVYLMDENSAVAYADIGELVFESTRKEVYG